MPTMTSQSLSVGANSVSAPIFLGAYHEYLGPSGLIIYAVAQAVGIFATIKKQRHVEVLGGLGALAIASAIVPLGRVWYLPYISLFHTDIGVSHTIRLFTQTTTDAIATFIAPERTGNSLVVLTRQEPIL